ncbi:MAG: hypothetical protein IT385_25535 [Deltaproteobacteria bacterium]|nr:hypothetical protein [Deltaproteobacteria bacterium]
MGVYFAEAVWDEVVARNGPVGATARAAYAEDIEAYELDGLSVPQTAGVIIGRIAEAQGNMNAGLGAFDGLVKSVDLAGRSLEGPLPPDDLMRHLLEAKLELARLYHHLSKLAPLADTDGVASPAETARMIEESEADLERWNGRSHA